MEENQSPDMEMEGMEMQGMEEMDGEMEGNNMGPGDMESVEDQVEEQASPDGQSTSAQEQKNLPDEGGEHSDANDEPKIDYSSDKRIQMMLAILYESSDFKPEQLKQHHYEILNDFLNNKKQKIIFFWCDYSDEDNVKLLSSEFQPKFYEVEGLLPADYEIIYFMKRRMDTVITAQNFKETIIHNTVISDPLDDLLSKMNNDYVKYLLQENKWPDAIKKEFISNIHRFMAHLNETSYAAKGQTYLYIPDEDLTDIHAAAKDKDMQQRLEAIVIYWTRQIKELISNQDSPAINQIESPLDEISYWSKRNQNLQFLDKRLQDKQLIKILDFLEIAQSSYLANFRELTNKIKISCEEAEDNLKYLEKLKDPCTKIDKAQPKDIPKILPEVLSYVRVIWELSKFYSVPERMKGLLTKISNQIIRRCRLKIKKEDMLNDNVEKCMQDLEESIECCNEWKVICNKVQQSIVKNSSKPGWNLNEDETIFAENEAFTQRCKDLLEICEGQLQFARKGKNQVMPIFGGTKGPEFTENLFELQRMFQKLLQNIKDLSYDILDVKNTKWNDDYGQNFKEQFKSLEIMFQNIIALALKNVSTVSDAVEMLENFDSLAKRPQIKEYVHRRAVEMVYKLFKDEIKEVESTFEEASNGKRPPPMPFNHPKTAGLAIWAYSLILRIDKSKKAIEGLHFIPKHAHAADAMDKYDKLRATLDSFVAGTQFAKWTAEIEKFTKENNSNIEAKLEVPILVKAETKQELDKHLTPAQQNNPIFKRSKKNGLLESNFDSELHKVLVEAAYWTKIANLGIVNIPHNVSRLLSKKEQLRILRENVMLIVRDYNNIIHTIDEGERPLFKDHLEILDRTIEPGIRRYNWGSQADQFVFACRKECNDVFLNVKRFQNNVQKMNKIFQKISSLTLTNIQKKLYILSDFMTVQDLTLQQKEKEFEFDFEQIFEIMMETYDIFIHRSRAIQNEWIKFVQSLDSQLKSSLRQSVKNSLLDFCKHITEDKKRTEKIIPIFRVFTIFDKNSQTSSTWKIIHDPTHNELKVAVQQFMNKIVSVARVIPRIEKVFRKKRASILAEIKKDFDLTEKTGGNLAATFQKYGKKLDPAYQHLSEEEKVNYWKKEWEISETLRDNNYEYEDAIRGHRDVKNKIAEIGAEIEKVQPLMEKNKTEWQISNIIRYLSQMRSERGQKRHLRANINVDDDPNTDPVKQYHDSIEHITTQKLEIEDKQAQEEQLFIILDCCKLKASLNEFATDFIQKLFDRLIKEAKEDLNNLLKEFTDTVEELKSPPSKLEQYKKNKDKYAEVRARMTQIEARREPIKIKFNYVLTQASDYDISEIKDEDKQKLDTLDEAWNRFQDGLDEANIIIKKCHDQLKLEVDNSIEDFKKDCIDNKKSFQQQAPYTADKNADNSTAFSKLKEFQSHTAELRATEEAMKFGLEIFDIDPIAYPEVSSVEKEIAYLTEVWELKRDWDSQWELWKDKKFYDLKIDEMEDSAADFQSRYDNFGKEVKEWGAFTYIKSEIDKFRNTLPLLGELRNDAMRDRHWKALRVEVKDDFDETSDEFNLEKVFSLNLFAHQEFILEIADNAKKQLKIELLLNEIRQTWEESPKSNLFMEKKKSKADQQEYYSIKSTENIYEIIEDHGGKLGNMKSSQYYREFDTKIDLWENNIQQITETLDELVQCQGRWTYLESIFKGQQDIARLLPNEHSVFCRSDQTFKQEMERLNKDKNCQRALQVKGFLELLQGLNKSFETIQKNLNQFLEAKRVQFPRFYFLSNEDLLEIVGQSKDPTPIVGHISKMFEGIHDLEITATGTGSNQQFNIEKMISGGNEFVELSTIQIDSNVESWLKKLIQGMKDALKKLFAKYYTENFSQQQKKQYEKEKIYNTIKNTAAGQVLVTGAQMQWTNDVTAALMKYEQQNAPLELKKCRANYKKKVESYVELVQKPDISPLERTKLVCLIIIDEHNREIIEKLYSQKISSAKNFEWLQQLRFSKKQDQIDSDKLEIEVEQTNCHFDYGYEYQGNNGRLVVTPLTDRAYMTLSNALNMQRGGAPQGPAGTGKTETVKDLAKNLAFYVVIQNCSDQMDTVSLGKVFAGLALSGAWGCFDEFNRILLDVLSVVAQQVLIILDAIRKNETSTPFGELTLLVQKDTGLFITMNPGYAGRSELPDNLACLFRPVAMMQPDFNAIAKITLMSEGFKQNEMLAKKVVTIYELMKKQLSKQDHYDFGMRAIKSVLNASGRIKRTQPDTDEVVVIVKAIRDMNLPKFIAEDVILFDNLFLDLFPDFEEPANNNDELQIAIEECLQKKNLQLNENLIVKIMQLYESKVTRHGNMLVGLTLSGKTRAWEVLQDAMNQLNDEEKKSSDKNKMTKAAGFKYPAVKVDVINPKAINNDELFGYLDDQSPPQWNDGILSFVLKKICQEKQDQRWMVLDGPVDTLWIESLNSVLDDSKLLTLNNGDRIGLSPNVRLLFEVENLAVASPATVSRAGMVYLDLDELGWRPYVSMWLLQKNEELRSLLSEFVDKYLYRVLKVKRTQCKELVKTSEEACVINLCKLFDIYCSDLRKADDDLTGEAHNIYMEKWFIFCLIWSVGATVEETSRKDIDYILRDIESIFPHQNTVFDHHINKEKRDWAPWDEKLSQSWRPAQGAEFHNIKVPTVDTVRNRFITQALLDHKSQILLVGHSGVGKTVLVEGILLTVDSNSICFTINFSAGTSSQNTQGIIESYFERKAKNKYRPKSAKVKAICFIDDLNMPRKDTFGSQPPLELIRQWMDYEFWYDRQKIVQNNIQDLQILAAMGKPGGGRAEISTRILSKFHVVNYTIPSEANMKRIFETICQVKFQIFGDEDIKALASPLAVSTINLFNMVQEQFLPTPAKSHYIFNMRDISKVFQGLDQAQKNGIDGKEQMLKLWSHEILRVFQDRLNSFEDKTKFKNLLIDQLGSIFAVIYAEHCTTAGADSLFVKFLDESGSLYREVTDSVQLRDFLNDQLADYNRQPKLIKMDLVLFKDAITHIAKIARVINLKRGHAFLVGVGGSGRHSLTKLSAFISKMSVFQLEVTKGFNLKSFREFLKVIYEWAAYKGRNQLKTVFIFSDNDVVQESFLEDIQNMLNGGVVPNLYTNEELGKIRDEIRRPFNQQKGPHPPETPEALSDFFFNNIKDNLHLSICMSPIGQAFRDYCRMYPALINNTTIDWFMGWPADALTEVANKFIGKMGLEDKFEAGLAVVCSFAHSKATENALKMKQELNRIFYVTPTNYIELLKGYNQILSDKRKIVDFQRNKLRTGLSKLDEAKIQVEKMAMESELKRIEVSKQQKICDDLLAKIAIEKKKSDESQINIEQQTLKIGKEKEETLVLAAEADAELSKATPALDLAKKALDGLDKSHISEIKAYNKPPPAVETVMNAVMTILNKEATWQSAKKELADTEFIKKIKGYDIDTIPASILKKIEKFTKMDDFQPSLVSKISAAAGALCQWVRSLEDYSKALKVVEPKRRKKAEAEEKLKQKEAMLAQLQEEFQKLMERLAELELTCSVTLKQVAEYGAELQSLKVKIDRGEKLINGLKGEKTRWEASIIDLDEQYSQLVGDCILAASFMSYCGPFPSEFRDDLIADWVNCVDAQGIPFTQGFDFSNFMATPAQARQWQQNGLPTDKFSTENGVFVTQGLRWALNIDPQSQAMNWIKKQQGTESLVIADQKDKNYMQKIEQGIVHGKKVLFCDVGQELDPVLDNVLNKSFINIGKNTYVKIGDREIEYNHKFKLFITTRMGNPHYTPEVSTKVTVVNFTVKESGLVEQCLGLVVEKEQPQLEISKNNVIELIAVNKSKILELEDKILRMLSESKVNLLEDVELINTLQQSKETSDKVKQDLEAAQINMKKINDTRENYRDCGKQASVLFFVLNDLNKIDPMYQFSLEWYKKLFTKSIVDSKAHPAHAGDRTKQIPAFHKQNVYKLACRSLFEKHKLLLSMQMCIKQQISDGIVDENEWNFFLKGGQVLDRATQIPKPPGAMGEFINQQAWDNITELEKALPETFTGLPNAIMLNLKEWQRWYSSVKPAPPESAQLPGEWETKCDDRLKKMIVLRCFRPDRVNFAIRKYVEEAMKKEFVETKPTVLKEVFEESTKRDPIIFVLSPGVDPTEKLKKLAEEQGIQFEAMSMGRGQSEKATKILQEGAKNGNWIFLANCHLSIALLPDLESIIETLFKRDQDVKDTFRLILSANPHPDFSISLLQSAIKITQEPPRGIKANMLRLYSQKSQFTKVDKDREFRKAVFGLCWFHTILIERKKFKSLGWNIQYAFNDSDYSVCEDLLAIYMGRQNEDGKPIDDNYERKSAIPWQAIQYLIAEANYGGRVTDDRDRRLISVYAKEIFNESLILPEKWKPVGTGDYNYMYSADEQNTKQDPILTFTPEFFMTEIYSKMEDNDPPLAYGQHINAEINSQVIESNELLDSILSLTLQKTSGGGQSMENSQLKLIVDLIERLPELIDVQALKYKLKGDDNPLNVVLVQEIQRYAILLNCLAKDLEQLEKGIQGLVAISPDLERILTSLNESKIPEAWSFAYFSLKPLASWFDDLRQRYEFFRLWTTKGIPLTFWIGAFTYPTGFTTSLLQRFSRKNIGVPIDKLEFDFIPSNKSPEEITEYPKDGAYITNLYLEGAKWDIEKQCLTEPEVMELSCPMPLLHFKPIQKRLKPPPNNYECPCYYYPRRQGSVTQDSWMLKIDVKSGTEYSSEFWVKRGAAILMSLSI